jgi:hypothetical protein
MPVLLVMVTLVIMILLPLPRSADKGAVSRSAVVAAVCGVVHAPTLARVKALSVVAVQALGP